MLLWADGFDHYGPGAGGATKMLDGIWASVVSSEPVTTQVRTGTYSLGFVNPGSSQSVRRIFGADKSIVGVGFALFLNALPASATSTNLATFLNSAGTDICTVTISTTGELQIRTGSRTGTVRATSPVAVVTGAWQHVEIKVGISSTVGTCEIRVNGVTVLNASNINTDGAAGGVTSNVSIGHGNSGAVIFFIDDIFSWDTTGTYNNDFIGDKKAYVLFPDADTAVADWVPDTGTVGFSRINEATPNDASYIDGQAVNDVSEFSLQDLASNVTAIAGLVTYNRALKTDAGDSNIQVSMLSNGADANGANRPMTTQYTYWPDVFEENPDTNSAWTRSAVNAALIRVERTL